jgi:ElaB/YqjD/DUF883 family membrane-anchored ribosome-binding protein/vacuolar-type H+-ATPase subunit H
MAERPSQDLTNPDNETDENDLAEETRLDIERTRASMGDTLDHIGERLSPERFKAEAVDAVGKLKEEAIDTAEHLKGAAVEAARAATQEVIHGVKNATMEAYDKARNQIQDKKDEIEGAGMTVVQTMKRNPIPTAMVGLGLYWLYQSLEENRVKVHRRRRYESLEERSYRIRRESGRLLNDPAVVTVGHAAKDGGYDGRVGEVASRAADGLSGMAESISARASNMADSLSHKASDLGEAAAEKAGSLKHSAEEQFEHYSDVVHEQGQRAADEFQHLLQDSPLVVAGVAAAIGLAFGMMLPDTQIENRAMGSTRDQLVDKAQETVSDLKDKAIDLKDKAVQVAATSVDAVVETVKMEADKQGLSADLGLDIGAPSPKNTLGKSPTGTGRTV